MGIVVYILQPQVLLPQQLVQQHLLVHQQRQLLQVVVQLRVVRQHLRLLLLRHQLLQRLLL